MKVYVVTEAHSDYDIPATVWGVFDSKEKAHNALSGLPNIKKVDSPWNNTYRWYPEALVVKELHILEFELNKGDGFCAAL